MAWGICFVSLSAIQIPLLDLQELVIPWSDKGIIRGYPVLPKSLSGRRVKFQSLSVSAVPSQRAAPGGTSRSTLCTAREPPCFPNKLLPTLLGCPSLAQVLSRSAEPFLAVPGTDPVLLTSSSTAHTTSTSLLGSLLYFGPVYNKVCS